MGMSEFYGTSDDEQSLATIKRSIEIGVCFLDTADMYGIGANERLVGRAISHSREKVFLATKFGIVRGEDGSRSVRGTPEYVKQACEASLSRLGVDHIDLYYQHRTDPAVPIEETVGAMAELVTEGKVRHLGLSEASPDTLRRADATHKITALQSEWSLWSRELEREVVPAARELGIGIVPYSPLGRGFLSGKITSPDDLEEGDFRRFNPRFAGDNFARNLAIVRRVEAIAEAKGITSSQLALAWLLHQGNDVVPIPGTRRVKYLEENTAATEIQLTKEDLESLEEVAPIGAASGERYPDMSPIEVQTPPPAGMAG